MKWRAVLSFILKAALLLFGVAMLVVGCVVLYATKPWILVTEVRASAHAEELRVSTAVGCEKEFFTEADSSDSSEHLVLCFPKGGVSPWDTKAGLPYNEFVVKGYRYKKIARDLFSGSTEERASRRIDVVQWNAVVPYQVISPDENNYSQPDWKPIGWKVEESIAEEMGEKPLSREEMKCVE